MTTDNPDNLARFGDWFENMTMSQEAQYGVVLDDDVGQGMVQVLMDDGEVVVADPDGMCGTEPEEVRLEDAEAYERLLMYIAQYTAGQEG